MVWPVQDDSSNPGRNRQGEGRGAGDRQAGRGRQHGDGSSLRSDEHSDVDTVQEGRAGGAPHRGPLEVSVDERDRTSPLDNSSSLESPLFDLPVTDSSAPSSIAHLQRLLTQCGFVVVDEIGRFGPSTKSQVRAFQFAKGIPATAVCDASTWHVLIEAHWKLGDRLLYLRRPMVRGDDVAQLQGKLSWLGFDPGKVDGIFGSTTQKALSDFQVNVGMAGDGICGPDTVAELQRNFGRSPITITSVKEIIKLNELKRNPTQFSIVLASSLELASTTEAARVSLAKEGFRVVNFCHYDVAVVAELSNNVGADVVVYLENNDGIGNLVSYFQGFHYTSGVGQSLSDFLSAALVETGNGTSIKVIGSRHRILQLTKAPCVTLALDANNIRTSLPHSVASAISTALTRWFREV